jgi:signal transduction histidine kinase
MRFIEVTVSDTGTGIAPENLARVFDPFFTTKEVGKGTGLGLAICQSIIEQHRGSIEVQSQGPGMGTAVTVSLPLAAGGQMVK